MCICADNNIINIFGELITTEDKSSQLMGATVVSNGDNFMVSRLVCGWGVGGGGGGGSRYIHVYVHHGGGA